MKGIIVGGNFGDSPKESSVIKNMAFELGYDDVNGGSFDDIKNLDLSGYKVIIWMPNIENSFEKIYPKKDVGSILICSKVTRNVEGRELEAISRIFEMHGNAVISIDGVMPFSFKFIDALGNVWNDSSDIFNLTDAIKNFVSWSSNSIRKKCIKLGDDKFDFSEHAEFIEINKQLADKFELTKSRFFGNSSTRCSKMFPTMRADQTHMIVSRRNVDKKRITTDDLVMTTFSNDEPINWEIGYYGDNKPSVDTPIQLRLYDMYPDINYMIHGHTYIKGGMFTENYYPCGDMREMGEISTQIYYSQSNDCVINLKNHGFLIIATSLESLKEMVSELEFNQREIGFELI